jgi:four helix bundle protein
MATVQQFEDLHVWEDARALTRELYKVTRQRAFRQDFGLRDQITRAATSTTSNIAEGFERGTRKEFIHFLHVAKGSNREVRSQLYVAFDQGYLDEKTFTSFRGSALSLARRLAKFISYLQKFPGESRVRNPRIKTLTTH